MNIKIDYDKIRGAICCYDLYKELDIIKYFDIKMITNVKHIKMHPKTGQKIFSLFMSNAVKGKDKRYRGYSLKERREMVSFDWLEYAPCETMVCGEDCIELEMEEDNG